MGHPSACVMMHAGEGSNWHLATPPEAMEQLIEQFGVGCECFASPMNATTASFSSAFIDTDAAFGSRGGFFSHSFTSGGSFEVGPPYNSTVLSMASQRLLEVLHKAERDGTPFRSILLEAGQRFTRTLICVFGVQERSLYLCVSFQTGLTTLVFSS